MVAPILPSSPRASGAAAAAGPQPASPRRPLPPTPKARSDDTLDRHPNADPKSCFLIAWILSIWAFLCGLFTRSERIAAQQPGAPEAPAPAPPPPLRKVVLLKLHIPNLEFCVRENLFETQIVGLCLPGEDGPAPARAMRDVDVDQYVRMLAIVIQRHRQERRLRLIATNITSFHFPAFHRVGFVLENDPGPCEKYPFLWIDRLGFTFQNLTKVSGLREFQRNALIDARAILAFERGEPIPQGPLTQAQFTDIKRTWYRDQQYPRSPTHQEALDARIVMQCSVSDLVEGRTFIYRPR